MEYNFRFDRSQSDVILHRLRTEKLLSQGWGGGSDVDLRVNQDDFVRKTYDYYGLKTTRIPSNLLRMRDLRNADLLVTPHLPEYGKVSAHVVEGNFPACYSYLQDDATHLNHRIRIIQSYGLDGSISIQNALLARWRGKLQWLRLPMLPLGDLGQSFRQITRQIDEAPSTTFEPSVLEQYFSELRRRLLARCKDELAGIAPSGGNISFEKVCERLVHAAGYQIEARNQYDRVGGDADLICSRRRSEGSAFETGVSTLLIQIKKHSGVTDEQAVWQLLEILPRYPDANAAVMSLADAFSEEATALAEKNGIVLLNGDEICTLLLAELTNVTAQ